MLKAQREVIRGKPENFNRPDYNFRVPGAGDDGLQPGMFGRLRIDYDQRADALVVPRVALLDDQAEPAVYTVRDSKAVRVPVKLGYSDGEWSEIRDGLEEGEPPSTLLGSIADLHRGETVLVLAGATEDTDAAIRRIELGEAF